jgi:non-heme chloroperoxidase
MMEMDYQPGKYQEVEPGVEIYYEERGEGKPILFIPGWTFSGEFFAHQLEHFSKEYRAIAIDPRSQGRSSKVVYGNDYATHGRDLARLIQALDLKEVVLVGWSFGCLQSWAYVRQEGLQNLRGVVSIDLSPKPLCVNQEDWVEGPLDEIAEAYNTYLTSSQGQRDFVSYYATEVMVQRQLSEKELFWIVDQSLKTPHYLAALLFASGMFSNYLAEARLIDENIPSMSIIAEHWSETAVPFMNRQCPKTSTAVLGGHMMFWEQPEKFNQILEDFLKSL